jgi:hypothetical protein
VIRKRRAFMSFVKRLFDVRNVKIIIALASVFGIIFLSCAIIDKDSSIAQAQENYKATSYIKIEGSSITTHRGFKGGDFGVRESLGRTKKANGDYTLIEIRVGNESLYILASDVCVCNQAVDAPRAATQPATPQQLEQMNQKTGPGHLYLEVPGKSCYLFNSRWI